MIRSVLGSRASIGGPLGSGRGGAAAAAWYLAGGVSAANCVAAYQPIGAASLAASYVNLANPGTYNAAPGVAPTFDTATGWMFNGSTQYLIAPFSPAYDRSWSFVVRYSDANSNIGVTFGIRTADSSCRVQIVPGRTNDNRQYIYGNSAAVLTISSGGTPSGVMAIAGTTAYINGVSDGSIPGANGGSSALQFHIAARIYGASVDSYFPGNIQAVAIYNTTLTAPQVAAISTAMAAL